MVTGLVWPGGIFGDDKACELRRIERRRGGGCSSNCSDLGFMVQGQGSGPSGGGNAGMVRWSNAQEVIEDSDLKDIGSGV